MRISVTHIAREALKEWQRRIQENIYDRDSDFKHSVLFYLTEKFPQLDLELSQFGNKVVRELEPAAIENNLPNNLPRIEPEDSLGNRIDSVIHHPTYQIAGDIIYSTRLLERMSKPGGLTEALTFMFLSSQAGEAGHNCPVACSAGIIRVLQKIENFPNKQFFLNKLITPSYIENFTGAQFLTEIQGGSDVGMNAVEAHQDESGMWRIKGEKWFCSNADAELILVTARYDTDMQGTKGLGLFLIPTTLDTGHRNSYTFQRLKNKLGTCSLATAEIDFHDAYAFAVGSPAEGFKMVMENVLHISRLFNTFCVLGMARRAYHIALEFARHRIAFGQTIIHYPLVKENLARIKVENSALLASIFSTVQLQDHFDAEPIQSEKTKLLLRLLANLNKHLSALWSVEHIHHALDILAGNGAIETFSTIPRLLRDSIVCENWEGTHNTLRIQILKDIHRHQIDAIYLEHIQDLISQIDPSEKSLEAIHTYFESLKTDLHTLKTSPEEIQKLKIKSIVHQMSVLYCTIHLCKEAIHQTKHTKSSSKTACLEYFILTHLNKEGFEINQHYLDLINRIVA